MAHRLYSFAPAYALRCQLREFITDLRSPLKDDVVIPCASPSVIPGEALFVIPSAAKESHAQTLFTVIPSEAKESHSTVIKSTNSNIYD